MAGEGVNPSAPSAQPGVGGNQGTAGGHPAAPQEGQAPAPQPQAPPSGFVPESSHAVPYERFQRENHKLQEALRENEQLRAQLQVQQQPAQPTAPSDVPVDLMELMGNDPNAAQRLHAVFNQMMDRRVIEENQKAMEVETQRYQQESWHRLTSQYPQLTNPSDPFFLAADQEFRSDPSLSQSPHGREMAVMRALQRMPDTQSLGSQEPPMNGQPTPSVTGSAPPPDNQLDDLRQIAEDWKPIRERNNMREMANFMGKHQRPIAKKDGGGMKGIFWDYASGSM